MSQSTSEIKQPRRSGASLIVLIGLAFLLVVAVILLVFVFPSNADDPLLRVQNQPAGARRGFAAEPEKARTFVPFLDGVVVLGQKSLTVLDMAGQERYPAIDVDMTVPVAFRSGNRLFVYDRDGTHYVLLGEAGVLYSGASPDPIAAARIASDGHIALLVERPNTLGAVTVLDPEGRERYTRQILAGTVLALAFTPDGKHLDLVLADTSGPQVGTQLNRYPVDIRPEEVKDAGPLAQANPSGIGLLPLIVHDRSNNPVLCGGTALTAIDLTPKTSAHAGALLWKLPLTQIRSVVSTEAGLAVIAREKSDSADYALLLVNAAGQIVQRHVLGVETSRPAVRGRLAAVGSGNRLMVVDLNQGVTWVDRQLDAQILALDFFSDRELTVVTTNGAWRLPTRA